MVLAGTLTSHINLFIFIFNACYFTALKKRELQKNFFFLFSWRVKRRREQLVRGTEQSKKYFTAFFV
jgi:hypothetical protein